jgi:TrmH family RNA methyltransferase
MITSRTNSTIKRIRALRHRKARDETGLFFVEGTRIVGEAVEVGAAVETIVVAPDLLTSDYGRELVSRAGAPIVEVSGPVFASLSVKDGPQGIGAVIRQRWSCLDDVQADAGLCWIALDAVQDPGNLGTILRTSDAVGCPGVILTGFSTDPHDSAALRASMGAIFSQVLVRAGFDELVQWAGQHESALVGTSSSGGTDYQAMSYPDPMILVLGSEREGLSAAQHEVCGVSVHIPTTGRSDSLNLGVATGVVLYEIFNQRRGRGERLDASLQIEGGSESV